MAYTIQWYIKKEVLFIKNTGEVLVDDLIGQLNETATYVDQSDRVLVHVVTDVSEVTKPLPMRDVAKVISNVKQHPRSGWVITVGETDIMLKFVSSVVRQLFKLRQQSFATVPEALAFLMERDPTINWTKADQSVLMTE